MQQSRPGLNANVRMLNAIAVQRTGCALAHNPLIRQEHYGINRAAPILLRIVSFDYKSFGEAMLSNSNEGEFGTWNLIFRSEKRKRAEYR